VGFIIFYGRFNQENELASNHENVMKYSGIYRGPKLVSSGSAQKGQFLSWDWTFHLRPPGHEFWSHAHMKS